MKFFLPDGKSGIFATAKSNRAPRNITRVIKKEIIPITGKQELEELTTAHIQVVPDCIKQQGSDHVALLTLNVLKCMLSYAISWGIIFNNLPAAIGARYVTQATRSNVALTAEEIGNSDWVEKCVAHKIGGIRSVYNRAEYLNQRREMIQSRADFVDAQTEERK